MSKNLNFDFSGKVAVVTGGSMGIGAATVEKFARAGAAVVIADKQEAEGIKLAQHLRKSVV